MSLRSLLALLPIATFLCVAAAAQAEIKIRTPGQEAAPAAGDQAEGQGAAPNPAEPAEGPPPLPPEATPVDHDYYAVLNGAKVGPMKRAEVEQMISQGRIDRDTLMWRKGLVDWQKAESLKEIAWNKDAPPAVDNNARFHSYLVGTWRIEYLQDGYKIRLQTTFNNDGTYQSVVEVGNIGEPYMISESTKGTWEVTALNDEAFTLISKSSRDEGKNSSELQVLDQDRVYNKALQEIAYRTG